MKYLIDTDWAVNWLRGKDQVVKKLSHLQTEGLGLSVISLAELYAGIYRSKNYLATKQGLDDFLGIATICYINEDVCQIFGKENAILRGEGKIIEDFDLLIASTCLYYDLTLLTNNVKHYSRIESLRILSENEI